MDKQLYDIHKSSFRKFRKKKNTYLTPPSASNFESHFSVNVLDRLFQILRNAVAEMKKKNLTYVMFILKVNTYIVRATVEISI